MKLFAEDLDLPVGSIIQDLIGCERLEDYKNTRYYTIAGYDDHGFVVCIRERDQPTHVEAVILKDKIVGQHRDYKLIMREYDDT